jgi:hypothetical protein
LTNHRCAKYSLHTTKEAHRKEYELATKTATDDLQGQVLDTIRKGQEAVVDGLRSWTEAAEQFVPKTAAWPGADRYPSPAELVDTAYDFTFELLKAQRDFFHKAIEVTTPLYERIEEQGAKAAKSVKS